MRIAVIMSTYNGERYLREQIESILNQEEVNLELFIKDYGSLDSTIEILNSYVSDKIHVYQGSNKGYCRSFIDCLQLADDFDYYYFNDQDVFWEKEKLKETLYLLTKKLDGRELPAVYYSNVKVSDAELNFMRTTALESVSKKRSFVRCRMVFNKRLWTEIFRSPISEEILSQWQNSFIISLCYSLGGIVCCDKNSYIRYRQHTTNTAGIKKRVKKEWKLLHHDKQAEIKIAREILNGWSDEIPIENKDVLELIVSMENAWSSKAHLLFSRDLTTGDIRLTLAKKTKILLAKNIWGGILKRIDKLGIISFDVFDTLISRDVCSEETVYRLMERKLTCENNSVGRNFETERRTAERIATKKYNGCATIQQIYMEMGKNAHLTKDEINYLICMEEKLEFTLCTPKYEGRVLYEYCLLKQKKIVLISDMYLSKNNILRMLRKCGYQNIDEDSVFVSCEMGSSKRSGKLFDKVASVCSIDKHDWLHIGDAKRSDWLIPKKCGIRSIYIPGEINHFRYKSMFCQKMRPKNECIGNGGIDSGDKICTKLMNNRLPWIRDEYERFGYECLGNLLWGFTRWLSRELKERQKSGINNYDRIYFLAREGQLLKKAFDIVNKNNSSMYLPVSRKALNGAALWIFQGIEAKLESIPFPDEFGIEQVEDKLEIELPETLRNRVLTRRFTSWKDVWQCNEIIDWLIVHESDLDEYSKRQYELFMELLDLNASVRRIAIVDIGWKGTMQHTLELLLSREHGNIAVDGYYVGVSQSARKNYPKQTMRGFLFHEVDENKVFAFSGLLEGIMTADHGSVKNYEIRDDGTISCRYYPYEYLGDHRVSLIQNGAFRALSDIRDYAENVDVNNLDMVSELWSAGRIVRFGYLPNVNDIMLFREFSFFDGNKDTMNGTEKKNLRQYKGDFRRSRWKTAYLKQNAKGIPFTSQLYALARRIKTDIQNDQKRSG